MVLSSENKKLDISDEELNKLWFRDICYDCGQVVGLSRDFVRGKILSVRPGNNRVFCPNGHSGKLSKEYVQEVDGKAVAPYKDFEKFSCYNCGLQFLLLINLVEAKLTASQQIYCPNGCHVYLARKPAPAVPKTPADVDYEAMMAFMNALGEVAQLEPKLFHTKEQLGVAIKIAKNALAIHRPRIEEYAEKAKAGKHEDI